MKIYSQMCRHLREKFIQNENNEKIKDSQKKEIVSKQKYIFETYFEHIFEQLF